MMTCIGVLFNSLSRNYFAEINAIFLLVVVGYAARHLKG